MYWTAHRWLRSTADGHGGVARSTGRSARWRGAEDNLGSDSGGRCEIEKKLVVGDLGSDAGAEEEDARAVAEPHEAAPKEEEKKRRLLPPMMSWVSEALACVRGVAAVGSSSSRCVASNPGVGAPPATAAGASSCDLPDARRWLWLRWCFS